MSQTKFDPQSQSYRTAFTNPQQVKAFLQRTDRQWIPLHAMDLIDALPWPEGVVAFMQIIDCYTAQRRTLPAEIGPCPRLAAHRPGHTCVACGGASQTVIRHKSDVLELDEMKELVQWLMSQIRNSDPNWQP